MQFEPITSTAGPAFKRLPVSNDDVIRVFTFVSAPRETTAENKVNKRTPSYMADIRVVDTDEQSTVYLPTNIAKQLIAAGDLYVGQRVVYRGGVIYRVTD